MHITCPNQNNSKSSQGLDAPQTLDHLSGVGKLIALVPFPSPNHNHSKSAYARPSDFRTSQDYRSWLSNVKKSIKEDDSIDIPNHFIRFFSYVEFYQKVFLGEISATKPLEPTPTIAPNVSQQCQIGIEILDYTGDRISVGVARPSHILGQSVPCDG